MSGLSETIISGTVVATLIGLGKLAFNKPDGYWKIALIVGGPLFLLTSGAMCFEWGLKSAGVRLQDHAPHAAVAAVVSDINTMEAIQVWGGGLLMILQILFWLPRIIGNK